MGMMRREISSGAVAILAPLSFILLNLSGITKESVLLLLTDFGSLSTVLKSIDIALFIVSFVFLGTVYGFVGLCGTCECKKTPLLILSSLTAIPVIFYLSGFGLFSVLFSLVFVFSLYMTEHSVISATEKYKKIDIREIVHNGTKKGVVYMTLFFAVFTLVLFTLDKTYTENAIDDIIPEDLQDSTDSFADSLKDQQRQAKYTDIETVEQSILMSMSRSSAAGMSSQEKAACVSFATQVVEQIDPLLKRSIDQQIDAESDVNVQLESVGKYLDLLPVVYPFLIAFTVFSIAEFFKNVLISPISGIVAWLLSKINL